MEISKKQKDSFLAITNELTQRIKNDSETRMLEYVRYLNEVSSELSEADKELFLSWLMVNYKRFGNDIFNSIINNPNPNIEEEQTKVFWEVVLYFIIKERLTMSDLNKWLDGIKNEIKEKVHNCHSDSFTYDINAKLNILRKENITAHLKKQEEVYFNALEEITENNSELDYETCDSDLFTFDPLHEQLSLEYMLEFQKQYNRATGLFRFPTNSNYHIDEKPYIPPYDFFTKVIDVPLDKYYTYLWIKDKIERKDFEPDKTTIPEDLLKEIYFKFKDIIEEKDQYDFIDKFRTQTKVKIKNGYKAYFAHLIGSVCAKIRIPYTELLKKIWIDSHATKVQEMLNTDGKNIEMLNRIDEFCRGIEKARK